MKKRRAWAGCAVLLFVLAGCAAYAPSGPPIPRITKEQLKAMLGNPEVIILDVRHDHDWDKSKEKIPGAAREDPEKGDIKIWAGKYPKEKTIVFY